MIAEFPHEGTRKRVLGGYPDRITKKLHPVYTVPRRALDPLPYGVDRVLLRVIVYEVLNRACMHTGEPVDQFRITPRREVLPRSAETYNDGVSREDVCLQGDSLFIKERLEVLQRERVFLFLLSVDLLHHLFQKIVQAPLIHDFLEPLHVTLRETIRPETLITEPGNWTGICFLVLAVLISERRNQIFPRVLNRPLPFWRGCPAEDFHAELR